MRTKSTKLTASKTALADLEQFLASTEGAMPMAEAHGFLTALASTPSMIMPSTWQHKVIGEPEFESMAQAQSVIGALMGLWNNIIENLNNGEPVQPPGAPDPEMVSRWCAGYLKGARLDEVWVTDDCGIQELFPFAVLAGEFDLEGEEDSEGNTITDVEPFRERYRARLGEFVLGIHQYWNALRREHLVPAAKRAATAQKKQCIGRNEKCPCGSGLKYKRCCGTTRAN